MEGSIDAGSFGSGSVGAPAVFCRHSERFRCWGLLRVLEAHAVCTAALLAKKPKDYYCLPDSNPDAFSHCPIEGTGGECSDES